MTPGARKLPLCLPDFMRFLFFSRPSVWVGVYLVCRTEQFKAFADPVPPRRQWDDRPVLSLPELRKQTLRQIHGCKDLLACYSSAPCCLLVSHFEPAIRKALTVCCPAGAAPCPSSESWR